MYQYLKGDARIIYRQNTQIFKRLMDAFKFAGSEDVLVGIPEEKTVMYPEGVTNVQLMYIHTHGSPVNGIPARPTIEPAITDPVNRKVLQQILRGSLDSAFAGNIPGARAAKQRAGMMAVNMVRERFGQSPPLEPNAPSTIRQKGSSAPLIDTGQLRNSITFVIRKK